MAITTKAALAAELKISKARVSQYVKAGLPVRSDGKLNREEALNWINRTQLSQTYEDKGVVRARKLVEKPRTPPKPPRSTIPSDRLFEGEIGYDAHARLSVQHMVRVHPLIVAHAVLEAGGSLEVAYTAAHLAHSPTVQAAGLVLHIMEHPAFDDLEEPGELELHDLCEPDWKSLAAAAGVRFDPAALRAHLDASPIWSNAGDEDVRRFERDLNLRDLLPAGTPEAA